MKALFFGGAFNPPSLAHIEMAYEAMKAVGYDRVVFVPSKSRYIQEDEKKKLLFEEEERFQLLTRVASTRPWMEVSRIELDQKEQPRTYSTMKALAPKYESLKLLLGSDKLGELETVWRHIDEIGKEFGFVCMTRNHDNVEKIFAENEYLKKRRSYFQVIPPLEKYQDISSTLIREKIKKKESLKGLVPEEIREEVEKKEYSRV